MDYCIKNIYPFVPISFYDWGRFEKISSEIKYRCMGEVIINRQNPYNINTKGRVYERRTFVKGILKNRYGGNAKLSYKMEQESFWKEISSMFVSVFVPGHNNNMVDRGHIQYLAFGACTISPYLPEVFPFFKKIEPNIHYIKCKDDYSDLVEIIDFCKDNRDFCIDIGENAKSLFRETSIPSKMWDWVKEKL